VTPVILEGYCKIFGHALPLVTKKLSGYSVSDDETRKTIGNVYHDHQYLLDPHGAVGYFAAEKYLEDHEGDKAYHTGNGPSGEIPRKRRKNYP
jgi:threonine synthase